MELASSINIKLQQPAITSISYNQSISTFTITYSQIFAEVGIPEDIITGMINLLYAHYTPSQPNLESVREVLNAYVSREYQLYISGLFNTIHKDVRLSPISASLLAQNAKWLGGCSQLEIGFNALSQEEQIYSIIGLTSTATMFKKVPYLVLNASTRQLRINDSPTPGLLSDSYSRVTVWPPYLINRMTEYKYLLTHLYDNYNVAHFHVAQNYDQLLSLYLQAIIDTWRDQINYYQATGTRHDRINHGFTLQNVQGLSETEQALLRKCNLMLTRSCPFSLARLSQLSKGELVTVVHALIRDTAQHGIPLHRICITDAQLDILKDKSVVLDSARYIVMHNALPFEWEATYSKSFEVITTYPIGASISAETYTNAIIEDRAVVTSRVPPTFALSPICGLDDNFARNHISPVIIDTPVKEMKYYEHAKRMLQLQCTTNTLINENKQVGLAETFGTPLNRELLYAIYDTEYNSPILEVRVSSSDRALAIIPDDRVINNFNDAILSVNSYDLSLSAPLLEFWSMYQLAIANSTSAVQQLSMCVVNAKHKLYGLEKVLSRYLKVNYIKTNEAYFGTTIDLLSNSGALSPTINVIIISGSDEAVLPPDVLKNICTYLDYTGLVVLVFSFVDEIDAYIQVIADSLSARGGYGQSHLFYWGVEMGGVYNSLTLLISIDPSTKNSRWPTSLANSHDLLYIKLRTARQVRPQMCMVNTNPSENIIANLDVREFKIPPGTRLLARTSNNTYNDLLGVLTGCCDYVYMQKIRSGANFDLLLTGTTSRNRVALTNRLKSYRSYTGKVPLGSLIPVSDVMTRPAPVYSVEELVTQTTHEIIYYLRKYNVYGNLDRDILDLGSAAYGNVYLTNGKYYAVDRHPLQPLHIPSVYAVMMDLKLSNPCPEVNDSDVVIINSLFMTDTWADTDEQVIDDFSQFFNAQMLSNDANRVFYLNIPQCSRDMHATYKDSLNIEIDPAFPEGGAQGVRYRLKLGTYPSTTTLSPSLINRMFDKVLADSTEWRAEQIYVNVLDMILTAKLNGRTYDASDLKVARQLSHVLPLWVLYHLD